MHHGLVTHYLRLQSLLLAPIAPHWSEYVWSSILNNPASVQQATFPTVPETSPALTSARNYVRSTQSNITSAEGNQTKKLAKGKNVAFDPKKEKKLTVFTATQFPKWQDRCVEMVRECFEKLGVVDVKEVSQKLDKTEVKKAMPFVQVMKRRLEVGGEKREDVFERKLPFEEERVLREMVPGLQSTIMKCKAVEVVEVAEGGKEGRIVGGSAARMGEARPDLPATAEGAMPGAPTFHFENLAS